MPRADGTDVSRWQGVIHWPDVAAAGITWAATRVWDRQDQTIDRTFAANRAGMSFARHRLLYDWLEPGQGRIGAERWLSIVMPLAEGEGAMLDAEQDDVELGTITEDDALDWLAIVEAATGRPAAVYTGAYCAGGSIWRSPGIFNGTRPRVFACYTSEAEAHTHAGGFEWDAWQWTSSGWLPGVSTLVDLDQVDHPDAFDPVCGLGVARPATALDHDPEQALQLAGLTGERYRLGP